MDCELMNTGPKICPGCRFANKVTNVECSNCGFFFDKKTVGAYQESPISATPSQSKESAPAIPIFCPECRFANKGTSVECSNCGFLFDKRSVDAYQELTISATPSKPRFVQLTPTSPIICPECR
ncbi:MAG: hypothetical protein ACXADY_16670, partial [Candidatus Hodarchaeales archaeon]